MSSSVLPEAPWYVLVLQVAANASVHEARAMYAPGKQMAAAHSLEAHVSLNNARQWLVSVKNVMREFYQGASVLPTPYAWISSKNKP